MSLSNISHVVLASETLLSLCNVEAFICVFVFRFDWSSLSLLPFLAVSHARQNRYKFIWRSTARYALAAKTVNFQIARLMLRKRQHTEASGRGDGIFIYDYSCATIAVQSDSTWAYCNPTPSLAAIPLVPLASLHNFSLIATANVIEFALFTARETRSFESNRYEKLQEF